jgi:hypothetical protein
VLREVEGFVEGLQELVENVGQRALDASGVSSRSRLARIFSW